jgi:GNAT superfamily N-acetyltransferase
VFTPEGTLIACARLVFPLGQDSRHLRLIHKLVAATGDPKLATNLECPKGLRQLLDLLDSFPGFHEYVKRLIRSNVRVAEVSRVIVAPEHREQGLGEVLVDSLLSLASQRQLQVVFLACHKRLKGFYESSGFYVLPGLECERFAGVNAPAIAMARKLTAPGEFTLH